MNNTNGKIGICLDTNILLNLFEATEYELITFNRFVSGSYFDFDIIIPDQVKAEWDRHVLKEQEKFINKTVKDIDGSKSLLKYVEDKEDQRELTSKIEQIKKLEIRKYKYHNSIRAEIINQRINDDNSTYIISRSNEADKMVVDFALQKKAPFFSNELNGNTTKIKTEAADALIFFTIYSAKKAGQLNYDSLYFITDNKKDFSQANNPSAIHDNLKEYCDEINLIYSNNLEKIMEEIVPNHMTIINEVKSEYLTDNYFDNCPNCDEEIHINSDAHIGYGRKPIHMQTYYYRCTKCKHEWDTGDLINDY